MIRQKKKAINAATMIAQVNTWVGEQPCIISILAKNGGFDN